MEGRGWDEMGGREWRGREGDARILLMLCDLDCSH